MRRFAVRHLGSGGGHHQLCRPSCEHVATQCIAHPAAAVPRDAACVDIQREQRGCRKQKPCARIATVSLRPFDGVAEAVRRRQREEQLIEPR